MYYTVFVFILYNTSWYFSPDPGRLAPNTVTTSLPITMLPVMGSAIPAVVDAVPRPGASAAERLAASQESAEATRVISRSRLRQDCFDALDSLLEERFAALGEPGITRPKDALRFTNNLEYKSGAQLLCYCMFCNTRVVSTGASRVLDYLLGCGLCPARVKQPLQALRAETRDDW